VIKRYSVNQDGTLLCKCTVCSEQQAEDAARLTLPKLSALLDKYVERIRKKKLRELLLSVKP